MKENKRDRIKNIVGKEQTKNIKSTVKDIKGKTETVADFAKDVAEEILINAHNLLP